MFKIIDIEALLNMLQKYDFKELHIHHTWKPCKKDFTGSNANDLQIAMKNYHVNTRGWQV